MKSIKTLNINNLNKSVMTDYASFIKDAKFTDTHSKPIIMKNQIKLLFCLMNLTDITNSLGHPVICGTKKGLKAATRPVNLIIAGVALMTLLSSFDAKAQIEADTIWGRGYILTKDESSGAIVPNTKLTLSPIEMQMFVPDTVFELFSGSVSINFNLPVYIYSPVGVDKTTNDYTKVYLNNSNQIVIETNKDRNGLLTLFDLGGRILDCYQIIGERSVVSVGNIQHQILIFQIQFHNGQVYTGKILMDNVSLRAAEQTNPLTCFKSQSTLNDGQEYDATYQIKWENDAFFTDSALISIHDGLNVTPFTFLMEPLIQIVNAQVSFSLNDTNSKSPCLIKSNLTVWPDSLEMIIPDTVYNCKTNSFSDLPVFIDTIPDHIINCTDIGARYWVKWPGRLYDTVWNIGYYGDSVLVDLIEGPQFKPLYVRPLPGQIPDNQDISGIVVDPNNNYAALANASIEVYIPSTNQLFTTTSDSDGSFRIDGLPLGKEAYFSAGDISGKGSIVDFPFNTIEEVINPSDSINSNFGTVLPDNVPTSSWDHIGEINSQGTNQEIIKFYLGNSFNETQKNTIRGYYSQLQSDLNNSYIFVESSSQLEDEGINIEYGTYQTNTTVQTTVTPLGNSLYPVKYANSTMGVGDYVNFVHETFLALGYKGVGWYSVMRIDSPDFTLEDKDIAREISAMYWNAVYQDEKTYMPIQYMQESMSKSAGAKAKINGEVKQEINQYKNGVGF